MSRRRFLALFLSLSLLIPILGSAEEPARAPLRPTLLMSQEVMITLNLLERGHYASRPLNQADFDELITRYMHNLDGRRLFFLASDEQQFAKKIGPSLGERMRINGSLDGAFEIFERYATRVEERVQWINDWLGREPNLNGSDTFQLDRSEAPWPADSKEADRLWDARLRAEIIELMLGDENLETAIQTVRNRYDRVLRSVREIEAYEIQEMFLTSLMQVFDPHSSFLSAETLADFSINMRLSLTGIGALLGIEDDTCVIRELVPGGPAKLSGELKPNDRVVAVAQEGEEPVEVVGFKLRRVVNMIRGERGTPVTLTIIPADSTDRSERRTVTLVRDTIRLNESRARAAVHEVPGPGGSVQRIGTITIPSFYGAEARDGQERVSVTEDVRELLRQLSTESIDALVLDLRRNGGGLLTEAIDLTGLFISRGPVVQIRDGSDRRIVRSDERRGMDYEGPLVVLTDRYTASASEIVAGALQNYGRAIVVGNRSTHGKGTVQQIFELRDFVNRWSSARGPVGAAKLTVQKFYLPNGDSTQRQGVIPDIILPAIEDYMKIGEADLEHALQWDRIESSRFSPVGSITDDISFLRKVSMERMQTMPEFDHLRRSVDLFRERQEQRDIPLNLDVRRATREADKALAESLRNEARELASMKFPVREIRLENAGPAAEETSSTPDEPASETDGETSVDELGNPKSGTPQLDVPLRESLRIAADLSRLRSNPTAFERAPVIAARSERTATTE